MVNRILVVEDEKAIADMTKMCLAKTGIFVMWFLTVCQLRKK